MLDKVGEFQVQMLSVDDTEEVEQSFAPTGFCTSLWGALLSHPAWESVDL